jgi:predicted nucleic acid-binding protein
VARVFVDTNVLFPFSVMDLMLALTEDGVHDVLWTEALLEEWERVIVREQRRSADAAARITAAIRDFFADSQIPESAYVHMVDDMPSGDPDDRHHIAAAVAGNADLIITWNRADFLPSRWLAWASV